MLQIKVIYKFCSFLINSCYFAENSILISYSVCFDFKSHSLNNMFRLQAYWDYCSILKCWQEGLNKFNKWCLTEMILNECKNVNRAFYSNEFLIRIFKCLVLISVEKLNINWSPRVSLWSAHNQRKALLPFSLLFIHPAFFAHTKSVHFCLKLSKERKKKVAYDGECE